VNSVCIWGELQRLVMYGLRSGLLERQDRVYARNRLLAELDLDHWEVSAHTTADEDQVPTEAAPILARICDWAYEHGRLSEGSRTEREVLEARLMDCLMPRPSEVFRVFYEKLKEGSCPECATDYLYRLSRASNYLRDAPTNTNVAWTASTEYGELSITINQVKPEKDPADIARVEPATASTYLPCVLCIENEGFRGGPARPARSNHRLVPISLAGETWYLQFSPYAYYPEHCIVIHRDHVPMQLSADTFERLLDFVSQFPHYFLGSNADLPGVGGSILSHDHFQGGRYHFPIERALVDTRFELGSVQNVNVDTLDWPMPVIRVTGPRDEVRNVAQAVWSHWLDYDDPSVGIYSHSGRARHNTVTPIARRQGVQYQMDIILRNNRASREHPLGVFHPHSDLHHIKKENIGLIEAMGHAILPGRLVTELDLLAHRLSRKRPGEWDERLLKHRTWYEELRQRYGSLDAESARVALKHEVGQKFKRVLEDAGVFKRTEQGRAAFEEFALQALGPFGPRPC